MKKFDWKVLSLGLVALSFAQASAFASEGGVSGGGGGTVPADPVSAEVARIEIIQAKLPLAFYFNALSSPGAHGIYWDKLFSGSTTIFDLIQTTTVEINADAPCVAPSGELTDGAAPGSAPNSICISTLRLSQKLDADDVHIQTLGLIAHELSHLLGTNEPEAVAVQTDLIRLIRGTSNKEVQEYAFRNYQIVKDIDMQVWNLSVTADGGDSAKIYEAATQLKTSYDQLTKEASGIYNMSYVAWDMMQLQWAMSRKVQNLNWALCAQLETEPVTKGTCEHMVDSFFKDASEVTLPELDVNLYGSAMGETNPNGFILRKITSPEILKLEVQDLAAAFDAEVQNIGVLLNAHW